MKQSKLNFFATRKPPTSPAVLATTDSNTDAPPTSPPTSAPTSAPTAGTPANKKHRRVISSSEEESDGPVGNRLTSAPGTTAEKENLSSSTDASGHSAKVASSPPIPNKKKKKQQQQMKNKKAKLETSTVASGEPADADMQEEPASEVDEKEETKQAVAWFSSKEAETVGGAVEWQKGDATPFAALAKTFEAIENTTKRLLIQELLTKFFVKVIQRSEEDLVTCVYLCINRMGPTWEGVELGIGETILMKAIASATGRTVAKIKADLREHGDLGKVAQASRSTQKTMFQPKPLTVRAVFKTLKEIAAFSGHSSMNRKMEKIQFLLVAARENEARYLIRSLEGKLRIGLAEQTVLVALAHASVYSKQDTNKKSKDSIVQDLIEATNILKQVYSELPTYEPIIPVLLHQDIHELPKHCKLTPGIPLKPMLAHPTKSISEVLNRFEGIPFTCEYKYDGERAQIHQLDPTNTVIFSRNQESMSEKYPDIMETMKLVPKEGIRSFVLDAEAVAWDQEKQHILPFQVLSTRKRKDVNASDIKVQVCVFAFDLLYLNGEPLIRKTLEERRRLLYDSFQPLEGKFAFAKQMTGQNVEDIQTFLDESVEGNCEGLMVKTLQKDSSYEPSKRSRNWLKVKKDYLEGVGDSLDLVVIGAYIGKGKRTGGYGGFLLACYDKDREEYQAVCKIGTGFSDEDLQNHAKYFQEHETSVPKSYYSFSDGVKPDVWFAPVQVWEVKTADLSISPVYTAGAGLVDPEKGISLRFPRFIRIREDKSPEQATTSEQIADMYKNQKINGVGANGGNGEEEEGATGAGVDQDFEY